MEVVPRLAATVVLLRPGRKGLEVLLTRRPASMAFAPDMHVFPGGRVDTADGDPKLVARSVVSPHDASIGLGGDLEPATAIAAYVAAIREVFEETGVLLADAGDSAGARRMDPPRARAVSQARSALVGGDADFASIVAELGLTLRTDLLVPLSRWVTPPVLPRRFDARFFAARLPDGAKVSFEGDEVAGHAWLTPDAALTAMAAGDLAMWIPTSATLQHLRAAESLDQVRQRLAPGVLIAPRVEVVSPEITRIVMPAGGGVPGQPIASYLVGRSRFVLIDPGDPIGPGLDLAIAVARERGGPIEAIALTQVAPDHAAGAEGLSEMLGGVPILAGPGAVAWLPYQVQELVDEAILGSGDVAIRSIHSPGPSPEHVAFTVGDGLVVAGDLDGRTGARSIPGAPDATAAAMSTERLHALAPGAVWLSSHPEPDLA